ncbi:MAG: tryptophan synthase subunit alpha [Candidatus Marinimicrobia bacterium]|nr:tryptophan synthase subunit alpha [Candidatus Neomarinimicrobiota bacterium]MBT6871310.1 tryptophan synthase subunit alpha [Candidatus Neomarinimicrobiota bacterium]|tara:strand:+ start:4086 stop:4847 length:762 start_codon:yes stop_codon:yes gene_type:complete
MSRIPQLFSKRSEKVIPFLTAGYPNKLDTVNMVLSAEKSGAAMVELGMPFSDPLADGPIIQRASQVAIENGVNIKWILEIVIDIRMSSEIPLVLMGYINPIIKYGLEKFLQDCKKVGIDGLIIPDLPPEEAEKFVKLARTNHISPILLVAPNTSSERINLISKLAVDLIYCVAILGITGSENNMGNLKEYLARVEENSICPFIVGFGIKNREDVVKINKLAHGAVVGSAIINAIRGSGSSVDTVKNYIERLVK